jgi:hypothetical protein
MNTQEEDREKLKNIHLHASIRDRMEGAARLFMQLPAGEHDNYLNLAVIALEAVSKDFLTPAKYQSMIATLEAGEQHLRTKLPETTGVKHLK